MGPPRLASATAKQIIERIADDIDGTSNAKTVSFAFAGKSDESDLAGKNKEGLAKALGPFVSAGRSTPAGKPGAVPPQARARAQVRSDNDSPGGEGKGSGDRRARPNRSGCPQG
ncbi:histone-like nucleoid-structuring protein Lsr2 [Cellulomonas sp. 73-145]|uniref:Lsr2 dimerization domain-containing protein n=1 Tax=Cellulomonas sp. 73-145 TaxID=1895739 RepID=UPI0034502587